MKVSACDRVESEPLLAILCVDDEENVLNSLKRLFRRERFRVLTATSGQAGLAILRDTPEIGLILSDQRMPVMSGTDFLEAARALAPDVPRLILTGDADVDSAMNAINQGGAYRFLTKPWQDHELRQVVRDGLHRYLLTQENQRLLAALRENEERFKLAFAATRDGIWDWNLETGKIYCSPSSWVMLGYSENEIEHHVGAWQQLLHPDDRVRTEQALGPVLNGAESYEMEFRLRHKDGHYLPILSRGVPVRRDSDGRTVRIVGTHVDLTERKQAERELMQARDEAVRANRVKSDFLANMSHELRTPLTAILGLSETLREGLLGATSAEQDKALSGIESSGRYLLSLINDVLDLAKIEADKMVVHHESISVQEVCAATLLFIKEEACLKLIRIVFSVRDVPQFVKIDQRRLKQILINLLSNAVKFTSEGGEIELTVAGLKEHNQLQFTVRDTGIGISAEDQARLFQPFTQVDSSLTRHYKGTGLGLALVSRLATLLGGSVSLESEPGKGSRFTVILPYLEGSGETITSPDREAACGEYAAPSSQSTLALVVDDNRVTTDMVVEYLIMKGFRTLVAASGEEALTMVRTERPDIILMDIQMPEMSGLEAIREIRNLPPPGNRVPIIALTALAMPGDRERCLEGGADDYISKPFRLRDLSETMTRLLARERGDA